jgi:plastocyanin
MKTKYLFSVLVLLINLNCFSTIWIVNNAGTTFTPDTIIINLGDTVNFVLGSVHNSREVSEASWNANNNTALPGGFETPTGGGIVLPAQLGVGNHYYVCVPHASMGMKGVIIVRNLTEIKVENLKEINISVFPNPTIGKFNLTIEDSQNKENYDLEIYNIQGQLIYHSNVTETKLEIDLNNQLNGIYFIRIYYGETVINKKIMKQ